MNSIYRFARQILTVAKLRPYAAAADCFLVSFPKSGRTWLRYLLSHYFAHLHDESGTVDLVSMFSVLPNFDVDPVRGIPAFRFRFDDLRTPRVWVTHLGYDRKLFLDKPAIMIVRDPRDVIVSAYFHATRHKHNFDGDILEFIGHASLGAPVMCRYLNGWAKGISERRSHVLSFEALVEDPVSELVTTLQFLGLPIVPSAVEAAVAAGDFRTMQALEKRQGIPGHSYDRNDPDSLRMRRGVPGGYVDYLDADALAELDRICERDLTSAARALLHPGQRGAQPGSIAVRATVATADG